MSTSGGGGYCDCGDVEAWKANHSCEMHQAANAPTYTVSMLSTTGGHDTGELSGVHNVGKYHNQGPHGSLKSLKVFKNLKSMKSL